MKAFRFICFPLLALGVLAGVPASASACTGLTVKTADGAVVFGRTLEFGVSTESNIVVVPRGYAYTGTAPGGAPGLSWKVRYGIVGANALNSDWILDGLNQAGLHVAAFYFPGFAGYQSSAPAEYERTIGSWEVMTWLLSSFATTEEATEGLKGIKVSTAVYAAWPVKGGPPAAHYIVTDASGKSAVVEYVGGELHVYDNPLGVITNAPTFDWHLLNLGNYVNLVPSAAAPLDFSGVTIPPNGQGSGMLGLPGDATPPSRFVRAVWFTQAADPVVGADNGVRQVLRLLNSFYLVAGVNRDTQGGKTSSDVTEWLAISDLTGKRYFFSTYDGPNNLNLVDLNKIDFEGNEIRSISMDQPAPFTDVTDRFRRP